MTVSRKLIIKKRYPRFPVIPRFNDGIIGGFKLTEQNWYKVLVEWITNLIDKKYLLQRFFSKFVDDDDDDDTDLRKYIRNHVPDSKRTTKPVSDDFFVDDDDDDTDLRKYIRNHVPDSKRTTKPVSDDFQNPFITTNGSGVIENRKMKQLQKELLRILSVYKNGIKGGAFLDTAVDPEQQIVVPNEVVKEKTEKKLQNFFKRLASMLKKGGKTAVVAANFIMKLISIFSDAESDTKNKKNIQPHLQGSGQTAGTRGMFQTLQGMLEMGGAAAVSALSWINRNLLKRAPTKANNAKVAEGIAAAGGVAAYLKRKTGDITPEIPLTPVDAVFFEDDANTTVNRTAPRPPLPPGSSFPPVGFRRPPPSDAPAPPGLPPDYDPGDMPWYVVTGANITFLNEALRYISHTMYVTRETLTILRIIINDLYLDPRPESRRDTPITNEERRAYLVRDIKRYIAQTSYKQIMYRITNKLILLALWGLGSATGLNFLLISTSMPFLISVLTSLSVSVVASIADKIDLQSKIGIGFDLLVRIVHIIMDKLTDILHNKKRKIDAEIAPSTAIMETIPVPATTSAPSTANIVSEVRTSDLPALRAEIRGFLRNNMPARRAETDEEHLRNLGVDINPAFDFTKQKKSNAKNRRRTSSKK